MRLTPDTVYQYLHKRQLMDEKAVINGHFRVHPVMTRNNIMKVLIQPDNSLFVKQAAMDMVSTNLFKREVNAFQLLNNNSEFSKIALIVPEMIDYDEENNIIVTHLLHNARNLCEHYSITQNFDTDLARGQANILSACHIVPDTNTDTSMFPKALPWVLQLDKFNADQFFVGNQPSTSIIQLIKDDTLLQQELIALAESWQYTHLIHGDIKWINFLAVEKENEISQTLIDWELADIGDPMWDVGGLLQSYITSWALGFDNNNPYSHQLPEYMKLYELKNMQPSARAFLEEYMKIQNYPEYAHTAFLFRTMQFTAARIIQTSVEGITYNTSIAANNMRCIQLAFNILKDPVKALHELFNIQLEPSYV